MEGFVTDFVQSDTTYMVLKSDRKLGGNDLNRVQVKMLASSNVPHVLDLHVHEVDGEAELHYNIGGKRMLSTCMRTEKITLVEYYALLLQIVTALEYGMTYMLNPNGFLLKENYMFVDGPLSEGTIYLTYIPLNESAETAASRERIGGLAARWMTAVDDLRGTGIQRILQMCEQSSFSLQALKNLLIGLLAGSGKQPTGGLEAAGSAIPKPFSPTEDYPDVRDTVGRFGGYPASLSPDGKPRPSNSEKKENREIRRVSEVGGRQTDGKDTERKESNIREKAEELFSEDNKNGRLIVPMICLLLLAILWKILYLDHPGRTGLLICVVATPLLLVFAYLGWTRKLKFGGRGSERRQEEEEAEALTSAWQEPRGASGHRIFYGQQSDERFTGEEKRSEPWRSQTSSAAADKNIPDFLKPAYAQDLLEDSYPAAAGFDQSPAAAGTGMLIPSASQPTVMLDNKRNQATAGASTSAASKSHYRLERIENGSLPKSIALPAGSFTIGRASEVSQYVETAVGISRAHVELELSESCCTIKDIGSRNGTTLNEEAITPYKAYELNEGDTFRIAGIAYTLKVG